MSPRLIANPKAWRGPYPKVHHDRVSIERARQGREWLSRWSLFAQKPTPLWSLPDLADSLEIAQVCVKDESRRSESITSFKALGAPLALVRLILKHYPDQRLAPEKILAGSYSALLHDLVVITATDGNHGRALAAAAQSAGCQCVIVLHQNVSPEREQAIAAHGARIVHIEGNYDDSVVEAARLAKENGWHVVSDTSWPGYESIPTDVMQGYGIIVEEIIEQTGATPEQPAFTHVFLQGGVGALPAGILAHLWEFHGAQRPCSIVVEPHQADCLYQSALQGHAAQATGHVDSVMAGLACGQASALAWQFLADCGDFFMTVEDAEAVAAVRQLARGGKRDVPIISGESGAAGLAGLQAACKDPALRQLIGLNGQSKVLLVSSEGATAPTSYAALVGESAQAVEQRQHEKALAD